MSFMMGLSRHHLIHDHGCNILNDFERFNEIIKPLDHSKYLSTNPQTCNKLLLLLLLVVQFILTILIVINKLILVYKQLVYKQHDKQLVVQFISLCT